MVREDNSDTIVFTDKMSLSQMLREKIFNIIGQYTSLYSKIRRGILRDDNIAEDDDWQGCWLNIMEFFFAVEADYLILLTKYDRDGVTGKDIVIEYRKIIDSYIKLNNNLTLSNLDFVFDCTRFLASHIGLMSIDYRKKFNDWDMLDPTDGFEFVDDIVKEEKKEEVKSENPSPSQ